MLLEQYLQNVGFDDKEAKVYLAGLQLGPATIQELAKTANIKRSTAYEIVEGLVDKNLIIVTQKGKRKMFVTQEPDNLLLFLKQREKVLEQIMPDLEALKNSGAERPTVRIYDGINGIKQIYEDMIKKPGEILALAAPRPKISKMILEYLHLQWKPLRLKVGVSMRRININESGGAGLDFQKRQFADKLEQVKYLPVENYPFSVGVYIYRQKVALISFGTEELVGIVIRSPQVNWTMKMIFENYWRD